MPDEGASPLEACGRYVEMELTCTLRAIRSEMLRAASHSCGRKWRIAGTQTQPAPAAAWCSSRWRCSSSAGIVQAYLTLCSVLASPSEHGTAVLASQDGSQQMRA